MNKAKLREGLDRRRGSLDKERSSFVAHWAEIAEFVKPRRIRRFVTDVNKGEKRHQSIINSKATEALHVATAGMFAGTMSPARPWFALRTSDMELMESQAVKIYLDQCAGLIRKVLFDSNFYRATPSLLSDLILFGMGSMHHDDDFDDVARFYTHPIGSYWIAQDARQRVTFFMREFTMTAEQLVDEYGMGNVSPTAKSLYDGGGKDSPVTVRHAIFPNPEYDPESSLSVRKRFLSVYWEQDSSDTPGKEFLRMSGYSQFPVYVPRWEVTGEDVYATDCPGMTTLGDIKALQLEEKRKAQAIDKMVNPPLRGPASLRNTTVDVLPGGLTMYESAGEQNALSPIYQVNPQIQWLREDMRSIEGRIDRNFFVDMFLAISNMEGIQPRNEMELMQRHQERLLQLGPVLNQVHGGVGRPVIDRVFLQLSDAGVLPPAPEELQGQELEVDFVSTLELAQRASSVGAIDRTAGFVAGLVKSGFVEAGDKFDADQAIDEFSSFVGTPPKLIVPDDKVVEVRKARAAAQAQQAQAEQGEMVAGAAKNMATALSTVGGAK